MLYSILFNSNIKMNSFKFKTFKNKYFFIFINKNINRKQ